jgi:preprotein translocase subunit SecF
MVIGLAVFVAVAAILMSLYCRTWKMSIAALVALAHDLVVTAGVYAITGVEVTPAAVIGFLTILGYSLYDTVVVFDKIRENAEDYNAESSRTFGELVNLAINQTLVRSINTSVVALLPVGGILFIGAFLMGAGTLRDIALALFIGIFVGALSTIFVAGPLYAALRSREPEIARTDKRILAARARTQKDGGDVEGDALDDDAETPEASESASKASAS